MSVNAPGAGATGEPPNAPFMNFGLFFPHGPDFITPIDPRSFGVSTTFAVNEAKGVRCVCPKGGVIDAFWAFAVIAAGNIDGGIFDARSAAEPKLWSSGPVAAVVGWQNLGNPAVQVQAGQVVDLAIACDNVTLTVPRNANTAGTTQNTMPAGTWGAPAGVTPRLSWSLPGAFPLPAALAGQVTSQFTILAMAHIT